MKEQKKSLSIYQVWDREDPAGTDSFWHTRREARRAQVNMKDPSEIVPREVGHNKDSIIFALSYWPMRRTELDPVIRVK